VSFSRGIRNNGMQRPIRIGINALFILPGKAGGLETVFRNLLSSFLHVDTTNEYVVFSSKESSGLAPTGPNIREVPCPVSTKFRPGKHVWEQTVFPFWLKANRIDILLSPGNVTPLCAPCPSVTVINDAIPFIRPENFGLFERLALKSFFHLSARRSAAVLTLSESAKRDLVRHLHLPERKVQVVYLAAEDRFKPSTENIDSVLRKHAIRKPYLICVASSRPYKNVDGLVRAFTRMKEEHAVQHQLVVVGLAGRAHAALLDIAAPLLRDGSLVFTGFVDDAELPVLYSNAVASVYPSKYEGFGLPVLESMACGTPVISSNASSLPEVVGDAGVLFDPSDIEAMSRSIYSVISDDDLRTALRQKGLVRAGQFSWDRTADLVRNILTESSRKASSF
jgi:glycosyltransferase involved in cell wall biosynthesis